MKDLIERIPKKYKYLIHTAMIVVPLWFVSDTNRAVEWGIVIMIFAATVVGTIFTQDVRDKRDYIFVLLLPLHLSIGILLSMHFFPNLSMFIRVATLLMVGGLFYAVSLVNNILLVVDVRENLIPLYRAAITWSQILLVIVAIPFLAGVFKLPFNPLIQTAFVALSSFLFALYMFWVLGFDRDLKRLSLSKQLVCSMLASFYVASFSISVAFIPTESFLRAIFVASVLMSALGYFQNYLKNSVTARIILEYAAIVGAFFVLLIVFRP